MQGLPCQASRLDGFAIKIPTGHLRSGAEWGTQCAGFGSDGERVQPRVLKLADSRRVPNARSTLRMLFVRSIYSKKHGCKHSFWVFSGLCNTFPMTPS